MTADAVATAGPAVATSAVRAGRHTTASRLRGLARRHWAILLATALAAVLRLLVMFAYRPAFWYPDSSGYVGMSLNPLGGVHYSRPNGYPIFLAVLRPTHTYFAVSAVQHAIGLLLGLAIYAFLIRRRVPRWLAGLACGVMLFDSLALTLEHYVLSETLFTALLVGGVLAVLWPRSPGLLGCVCAGGLLALAWVTRPSTLPVGLLVLGYLLLRAVGWRPMTGAVLAFVLPLAAVVWWVGDRPSAYGSTWTNRVLFGRVAIFADCTRLRLDAQLRALCPAEPVGARSDRSDWYVWNGPAVSVPHQDNEILREFAVEAIRQQPVDYLRAVGRDLAPHFLPWQIGPASRCLRGRWTLPATLRDPAPFAAHCHADPARGDFSPQYADSANAPPGTALTRGLHAYSTFVRLPSVVVTVVFLLTAVALAVAVRRRRGWPEARDALLLVLVSAALLVPPVVISMYELRYGLPAVPFVCLAGALAWRSLNAGAATAEPAQPPATPPRRPAGPARWRTAPAESRTPG